MNIPFLIRKALLVMWGVMAAALPAAQAVEKARPNIVFILIDDLGWRDLGCYGSDFYQTPAIDQLAAEGMRFTDAYAACPVCSPTRASILTGKSPARLHLTDWLPGRRDTPSQKLARPQIQPHLAPEERTLAEVLKGAGYVSASIGKWHLGGEGFAPTDQGFGVNVAGDHTGTPISYFAPFRNKDRAMPGLDDAPPGEYLTDRLTREAEQFIEQNRDKPFLLYLAQYAVHIPLRAKEQLIGKYRAKNPGENHTNIIYAAMIESVDESVARIVRKLGELGLSERTVIAFTSDNGGLSVKEGPATPATSNHPLRAGKGYLYEGGIRVPLIVKWPGVVEPGAVCSTPVISTDFFSTLAEMAGAGGDLPQPLDGTNLLALLRAPDAAKEHPLYWHYPHYSNQGGKPGGAVRKGRYKLIERYEDGWLELYDLDEDIGETVNLANQRPARAAELQRMLAQWRAATGAQTMAPNPEFNPRTEWQTAPPHVIRQAPDGTILLHARHVAIHGDAVRYEAQPHKDTIGFWKQVGDWVSWDFLVRDHGEFKVEILQGCGVGSGGSEVEISVADQSLPVTIRETGGFQNFVAREAGTVRLAEPGRYRLAVKPITKPGVAVMDLRAVTLRTAR